MEKANVKQMSVKAQWQKLYDRMEEKCQPHWKEYNKLRQPFFDNYKPSDGNFHDLHDKVLGKAYDKYLADTKAYVDEYVAGVEKMKKKYTNSLLKTASDAYTIKGEPL